MYLLISSIRIWVPRRQLLCLTHHCVPWKCLPQSEFFIKVRKWAWVFLFSAVCYSEPTDFPFFQGCCCFWTETQNRIVIVFSFIEWLRRNQLARSLFSFCNTLVTSGFQFVDYLTFKIQVVLKWVLSIQEGTVRLLTCSILKPPLSWQELKF